MAADTACTLAYPAPPSPASSRVSTFKPPYLQPPSNNPTSDKKSAAMTTNLATGPWGVLDAQDPRPQHYDSPPPSPSPSSPTSFHSFDSDIPITRNSIAPARTSPQHFPRPRPLQQVMTDPEPTGPVLQAPSPRRASRIGWVDDALALPHGWVRSPPNEPTTAETPKPPASPKSPKAPASPQTPKAPKTPKSPQSPKSPASPKSPTSSTSMGSGSIKSARNSLELAPRRRYSPLSWTEALTTLAAGSSSSGERSPRNSSTPSMKTNSSGDAVAALSSLTANSSTNLLGNASPNSTINSSSRHPNIHRRPSRARAQPGYVNWASSPPSSTKGPHEPLEEQYSAIREAQKAQAAAEAAESEARQAAREHKYTSSKINARRDRSLKPPMPPLKEPLVHEAFRTPSAPQPPQPPVKPSLRSVYTIAPLREGLKYLIPAVAATLASSLVQPFVSTLIGDMFGSLSAYPPANQATPEQRHRLMVDVGWITIKLICAGVANIILEYLVVVTWTLYGENVAAHLRTKVYDGVRNKPMSWYDLGMGMGEAKAGSEAVGSGGLMGKFARETDDVRVANSLPTGLFIQSIATFFVCLILALSKLPLLALVTMSSLPLIALCNALTSREVYAHQTGERLAFAEASTTLERTTTAIATVKAHNAQKLEADRFAVLAQRAKAKLVRQAFIWGNAYAVNDFLILIMFILGFWYGATLVNNGTADVATVATVFWAALLGAGGLQGVPPQLMLINKGKASLASLLTVIQGTPDDTARPSRKPSPARFRGAFGFDSLYFAYPSRPDVRVLRGIDIFIPCGETTFIVGESGSGKSTIAHLLLRLYEPEPGWGTIELDDIPLSEVDPSWTKGHIAAVSQGCLILDMSVHDNVAMGVLGADESTYGRVRKPEEVTRAEVIDACKMAFIHDFIESLPQGYDTMLGTGGSSLSGGQKQRLAIARARVRDPTVLILDEATAALDATSRVEVFEAIRRWRQNSTTIVITHDLSQITGNDFVYVMQGGKVVDQGFKKDLIDKAGHFAEMAKEQSVAPLQPKLDFTWRNGSEYGNTNEEEEDDFDRLAREHTLTTTFRMSMNPDALNHATKRDSFAHMRNASFSRLSIIHPDLAANVRHRSAHHLPMSPRKGSTELPTHGRTGSSVSLPRSNYTQAIPLQAMRRPAAPRKSSIGAKGMVDVDLEDESSGSSEETVPTKRTGPFARSKRQSSTPPNAKNQQVRGFFALMWRYLPTIPHKPLMAFGTLASIGRGVCTPIWSYFLAKLMALLGNGTNQQVSVQSGILVGIVAAQGLVVFAQHVSLASLGAIWTARLRCDGYTRVLKQDKSWFDKEENSPPRIVQGLVKDVEDMRHIVATVLPKALVAVFMVGLGFVWALIVGWQLTLVGMGIIPVFGIVGGVTTTVLAKAEVYNKVRREAVSRLFFESVANVRGIRAMALERSFTQRFAAESSEARRQAQRVIWYTAIGTAFNMSMPLFAQALLNYVGALFVRNGVTSFGSMLQVYTLILFSVTSAVGLLGFLPLWTKAKVAAADYERFRTLPLVTSDSSGESRPEITGNITFSHVAFAYPDRDAVFTDLSFALAPGEVVAIVGPSGCGKSTIAALLQRLYAPSAGTIKLGATNLADADIVYARSKIAVVSQVLHLFDASVADNIRYGSDAPIHLVERAAREARIHEFVRNLPQGYETRLGENASLVSGGQAQRLQIARALLREARILILDEATSALDVENQHGIVDTVVGIKANHTTIFITHSVDVMRRCDRVICLGEGRVAEEGTYTQLMSRGGTFAQLMKTGEWE